ncbi:MULTISPECIES: sulfur oxidation c-type cytochrome SoxA [Duganella]|uniref:sulfur oxidation c-type cytochrome SoxA n=1 Tax=Duganella TaxID=75654 RepID=UPI00159E1087
MRVLAALLLIFCIPATADDARRSGSEFMSASTQAMQRDDTLNPGMLWVSGGEAQWNAAAGKSGKSCASCHGDARTSMRGVAARFPAFDGASKMAVNLSQRINICRERKQQAPALRLESEELLGLEAYVAMQSRGLPVAPPQDTGTKAAAARGKELYFQRVGQLNLSCAQCHDQQWGKRLAGSTIPQAHAAAYPIYRLEWQAMGSLQRRLRNCLSGVRAEIPPLGAQELVQLEAWLAVRDQGMPMESPAVRP